MIYPIRDPREYQNERLREAERQRLIRLAMSSRQHPQTWRRIHIKINEYLAQFSRQLGRAMAHHLRNRIKFGKSHS